MPEDIARMRGERVDERDTLFARMARLLGTLQYEGYYSRHPELKAYDDRLAKMTPLLTPGSFFYDAVICAEAQRYFEAITGISIDQNVVSRLKAALLGAKRLTPRLKRMILDLGAVAVGCAALDKRFVYTHKGRFDEDYGKVVSIDHPSAVVFLVEMNHQAVQRAPRAEMIRESARQYYRAALIAQTASSVLEACGYRAKAHYDAHYDVILPPLALAAGLGEMGRNNILIADRHGSRIRIGAVTTDAPVEYDRAVSLGADSFCSICRKCADSCPPRALSFDDKQTIRGAAKWPTHAEHCYAYWRKAGSDCGICMAVCPYSHRSTRIHNALRRLVRRTRIFNRILLRLDDLVYGRDWKSRMARQVPSPNP